MESTSSKSSVIVKTGVKANTLFSEVAADTLRLAELSRPDKEAPESFREFLESAARQGSERIPSFIKAVIENGNISPA
jgi:hypothetical protein